MVYGVYGVWCMVVWCMVYGGWCLVVVYGTWWVVYGVWCGGGSDGGVW